MKDVKKYCICRVVKASDIIRCSICGLPILSVTEMKKIDGMKRFNGNKNAK